MANAALPGGRAAVKALWLEHGALRPLGTLDLKSTQRSTVRADTARLAVDELRLMGSRCGPFPRALELLASGELDLEALIDHR